MFICHNAMLSMRDFIITSSVISLLILWHSNIHWICCILLVWMFEYIMNKIDIQKKIMHSIVCFHEQNYLVQLEEPPCQIWCFCHSVHNFFVKQLDYVSFVIIIMNLTLLYLYSYDLSQLRNTLFCFDSRQMEGMYHLH